MSRRRNSRDYDGIINQFYSAESISPGDTVILPPVRQLPQLPIESDRSICRRGLPIFENGALQFISTDENDIKYRDCARSLSVNSTVVNETRCCEDPMNNKCCIPRQFQRTSNDKTSKEHSPFQLSGEIFRIKSVYDQHQYDNIVAGKLGHLYKLFLRRVVTMSTIIKFQINDESKQISLVQESVNYIFKGYTSVKRSGYRLEKMGGELVLISDLYETENCTYDAKININPGFSGYSDSQISADKNDYNYATALLTPDSSKNFDGGFYNSADYASSLVDYQAGELRDALDHAIQRTKPTYGHNVKVGNNGNYIITSGSGNPRPDTQGVEVQDEISGENTISNRWVDLNTTTIQGKKYIVTESEYDGYVDLHNLSDGVKSMTIPSDEVGKISISSFDATIPWVSNIIR